MTTSLSLKVNALVLSRCFCCRRYLENVLGEMILAFGEYMRPKRGQYVKQERERGGRCVSEAVRMEDRMVDGRFTLMNGG